MKTFRKFIDESEVAKYEWFSFDVDGFSVHILFKPTQKGFLVEAKQKGTPLGGKYSAQFHRAHSPVGQDHIHVYEKNNQLFAMNVDGKAHDKSHGVRIPNIVATAIVQKFPMFNVPDDKLIESAPEEIMHLFREQILFG